MNYIQVDFTSDSFEEYISDILASELVEIGFESFEPISGKLSAYIQENAYNEAKLKQTIEEFPFEANIEYKVTKIIGKNWNEEWEKHYFEPIIIGDECVIHSSFHKNVPKAKFEIVIDPKMSFGTGHHETTSLVIAEILKMNLEGKSMLDMGCGTSVLAILASMCKAESILAIDIDPWCTENSKENIELNKVTNIEIKLGGAELLDNLRFDIILANINRNILLNDLEKYAKCLVTNGELFMSGFYKEDIQLIEEEANRNNLKLVYYLEKNNWVVVKTVKN